MINLLFVALQSFGEMYANGHVTGKTSASRIREV